MDQAAKTSRAEMKLYYSDVLAPRKACAIARYLKSDVEFVYLDLGKLEQKTPAYLALNPHGTVPTLTEGDQIIWEADAILCHLALRAESDLWPRDHRQVAIIQWLSWNSQHFMRCGGELYFNYIIKPRFSLGPPDADSVDEALAAFRKYAGILNAHLDDRKWVVGDAPSIADFSLAIVLPYAGEAPIPIDEFPQIRRWHDQLNEFDAWRDPFPVSALP